MLKKFVLTAFAVATMSMAMGGVAMADEPPPPADDTVIVPPQIFEDYCPGGYNVIVGSVNADLLQGSNCDDQIFGFGGDDRLRGRRGYDVLRGGRGDDVISDPSTEGSINGGRGFDTCIIEEDSEQQVRNCEFVVEV